MERAIEKLLEEFDAGRITRRQLVKSMAFLSIGVGGLGATVGKAIAQDEDDWLPPYWLRATVEGIANLNLDDDGNISGQPFRTSADHEGWLFADRYSIHSSIDNDVAEAVERVRGNASDRPDQTEINEIQAAMDAIYATGAIDRHGNTGSHYLYNLMKLKIQHACHHCQLALANEIYDAMDSEELKSLVIEESANAYFNESGRGADFFELLNQYKQGTTITGHDW